MSNNFGDNLNYFLIKAISGKEPIYTENRKEKHFIVCGSIAGEANQFSTVWGAGFANYGESVGIHIKIAAVRGKLSAGCLNRESENIIVGDPALLMPMFYKPEIEKKYEFGIVPHWKDIEKLLWMDLPNVKIISPLQNVQDVVNDIVICENILSSSLHGLILADAYGVPNKWLDMGTDIGGDGFKFKDYYSTTKKPYEEPISDINFDDCKVSKYDFDLDELLKSCPFKP